MQSTAIVDSLISNNNEFLQYQSNQWINTILNEVIVTIKSKSINFLLPKSISTTFFPTLNFITASNLTINNTIKTTNILLHLKFKF